MMNQFTSIYSQLFCCSCPGGLTGSIRCENRTGIFVTYPLLSHGNYAWVAGILCFLLVVLVVVVSVIYCCKRRRSVLQVASMHAYNIDVVRQYFKSTASCIHIDLLQ